MCKLTDVKVKSFFNKNIRIGTELTNNRVIQKQIHKINLFSYLFSLFLITIIIIFLIQHKYSHATISFIYLTIIIFNHIIFRAFYKIKLYSICFATLLTLALCEGILSGIFYGSGIIGTSLVILIVMNTLGVITGSIYVAVIILIELYIYFYSSQISWIYNYTQTDNVLFLKYLGTQLGIYILSYITIKNQNELCRELNEDKEDREKLFTNIVHDLKTPLTIIHNDLDKYVEDNQESSSATKLKSSVLKMEQNILNILKLYKFDKKDKSNESKSIINLSLLTQEICNQFLSYSLSKEIEIVSNIESDLFSIIDEISYYEILNNLLDNAIKFSSSKSKVFVTLQLVGKKINLQVKDSGIGIAEKDLKSIFNSYYQVNKSKNHYTALGIGLTLITEICKSFNCKIYVDSQEGKGSIFTVEFPQARNNSFLSKPFKINNSHIPAYVEDEPSREYRTGLKSILIVENNNEIRNLLIKNFNDKFNIITSINGSDALEKFYSIPNVDLIITDIMMPKMNGIEFIKKIKSEDHNKSIPVIFLTAKQESDEVLDYISLGAIDYIIKPFSIKELLIKVETLLNLLEYKQTQIINSIGNHLKDYIYEDIDKLEQINYPKNEIKYTDKKFKDYLITNKEQSIISEISQGKSYKEIAFNLNISINTVNSHIHRIYKKCKVNNSASLLKIFYN